MAESVEQLLAELIRFDTTNFAVGEARGEAAAAEFVTDHLTAAGLAPRSYEREPGRTNVVARVPGSDPTLDPLLVHAHLDVVPADPELWSVSPFAGEIADGYVWGRGAVDMKDMCAMLLAVLRRWALDGRRPRRDIVLAFVADEETGGHYGAAWLAEEHPELFDGCAAAISESGGYSYHATSASGEPVRLYPVGTAERGTSSLRLTATGRAGHASRRNDDNAVRTLVDALSRLAAHDWPVRLFSATQAFLERAGAALGVEVDLSDVDGTLARLGPAAKIVESTVRSSTTPTVLSAGNRVNVIPSVAHAHVDGRTLPGSEDEFLSTVDSLLGPKITREFLHRSPAVHAPIDSPWFDAMADALRANDSEAIVVPYCLGGGTDAKAFSRLGIQCYGFAPLRLPVGFDYRAMAHGVDERVPVDGLRFGVEVLDHFLSRV
ncbi:acetylornithine deacetylase/succinyl-diaminopimelate desuccinylase-like protein [Herbihabitans rhizosphaerae]|uniref:Acetylornithine deacetylase/succinyl-diaminopimelate desuccinylase-like protein n=1 Tax=Herbihabitans rhizosphaerae TaxID=1872711 RepID=A0A4Q7L3D3_9PSEU|nr:M20/M25/M40 family metallo-hydrolase [Herbihabitans rhizosphaerae]RZS43684.1 acetylornithine deacetylase/succinyl-diaminopimelate desuccinylase-like protein [Herbihabitans rhizosphaerae]